MRTKVLNRRGIEKANAREQDNTAVVSIKGVAVPLMSDERHLTFCIKRH